MDPVVSICIPTFQRLAYLKEAVAAALAQSISNIEVLISDDGSSEQIQAWSEATAQSDSRVRYRRNATNLGLGGNWNACVTAARGEWILIQGDDDRVLPNFCEVLLGIAAPESAVLFSNHYVIDSNGARLERESQEWTTRYARHLLQKGRVADSARCVWNNSVPMSSTLVRATHLKRLGIKVELNTPEIELFARLAAEGARFDHEPSYLTEYRIHAESATTSGLFSEHLFKYLEPIVVPTDVEPTKRTFMAALARSAVDRLLRSGSREGAAQIMRSAYYPRNWSNPALLAQALAVQVPAPLGIAAYLFARRIHEQSKLWRRR